MSCKCHHHRNVKAAGDLSSDRCTCVNQTTTRPSPDRDKNTADKYLDVQNSKQEDTGFWAAKQTHKIKFTPRTGHEGTQGGVEVQLYSFFNLGARWGWVVNATPRPLYPGTNLVLTVQVAGWAPGPVWMGAENLAPHQDSILGPSSPQRNAIPTTIFIPTYNIYKISCIFTKRTL